MSLTSVRVAQIRRPHIALDIPIQEVVANPEACLPPTPSPSPQPAADNTPPVPKAEVETYVICRLGNDSQIAADALRSTNACRGGVVKDLIGGLRAWSRDVDPHFPVY